MNPLFSRAAASFHAIRSRVPRLKPWRPFLMGFAVLGAAATQVPWTELTEADWVYAIATRFALVDGHRVHYPTPTAELAKLLEGRTETAALRHLADARMNLGDRKGALEALERWAAAEGAAAWDEAARWAEGHREMEAAFRAAEKALPGLPEEARRSLAGLRITWAERHPGFADALELRKARAALFPQDAAALEDHVRALEKAGRLQEAGEALAGGQALHPERRLLLRAELLASHGDHAGAFRALDGAATEPWSMDFRRAYAARVDRGSPTSPAAWRRTLETGFDAGALVRLATCFEGQGRGDAAADLLRQMDRRYGQALDRKGHLLLARLWGEIDAVPEAFRARLAAAHVGGPEEQASDLAALAHLALAAGSRPLAWGAYNDESYKWVASLDRTPGFWTGGISFLLTGEDWKGALERLENESLPHRTFATARLLMEELARRAPNHADLPALRVAVMRRHVERGEGQAALAMLPLLEQGPAAVADEARQVALLAARQVKLPMQEEARLLKARLKHAAPDGSRPMTGRAPADPDSGEPRPWSRSSESLEAYTYRSLLDEAVSRLERLDPGHRASLDLILAELDRLPDDENLWLMLASRLEGWNLDDELGPRFERALKRFQGTGIWSKAARWYARRNHQEKLRALARDVAGQFRGAALFNRASGAGEVRVEVPDQPAVGGRVRMVLWADWIRLKALERFPHSPQVVREAQSLVAMSAWQRHYDPAKEAKRSHTVTVAPDALLEERRWAVLFVDEGQREAYFAGAMRKGTLEASLLALEAKGGRTPAEDQILFEGWSRLSRFEQAMPAGDRLAASYPGDGALAQRVLSLHRSLNGLASSHAAPAHALVARTAPALEDPSALWTELGELEEERGRPDQALAIWKHLADREEGNADRMAAWATLLWDYHHDREALAVVEETRRRLQRPHFFAFETGVLRENVRDLEGAVREYLNAIRPEASYAYTWFESDQRSLRRLAQLLGRERVYRLVEARIRGLRPGSAEDERALLGYYPLADIEPPAPGLDWDADAWIDGMDLPNDPVGRSQRQDQRAEARPKEYGAIRRIGDLLLEKSREMGAQATQAEFLEGVESRSQRLADARWTPQQVAVFKNGFMARRAELAPTEEERIRQEMARADFLSNQGMGAEADALWSALDARIAALPEGLVRMKAEAGRAAYLERAKGAEAAAKAWRGIAGRYPWSLGLLEDHMAFLARHGQDGEARAILEGAVAKAATGHREPLLERLTRECLLAGDLARARRAVQLLLASEGLDDGRRLGAIHLMARLSLKEDPAWDAHAFAKAEAARLKPEHHAELYHGLAEAADLENARALVPGLWIEALNRRTERVWVEAAARASRRAGKGPELLAFFEKQLQRSPRDVRWAVAVRDIRKAYHEVEGALEAAKAAVSVRPEQAILWREAVELLVRADRPGEAADFLEGWNRPRPADEGVATWRSQLYAQAGDGAKALAVEQAALQAYARERADDRDDLAERRARAAGRLLDLGFPDLALRLVSPKGDARDLPNARLAVAQQAQIALLNGQFMQLLAATKNSDDRSSLARELGRMGSWEQREALMAHILQQVMPATGQAPWDGLDPWWNLAIQAGLTEPLRLAMAERLLARRPGPWQGAPPARFLRDVGEAMITLDQRSTGSRWVFAHPDVEGLWALDLARRDKADDLFLFIEPRWQEMMRAVRDVSGQALSSDSGRRSWSLWLDDGRVLAVWARAASSRPGTVKDLADVMSQRRLWDRFWVLAARHWRSEPLLSAIPEDARLAWFRFWQPKIQDPVLVARARSVEQVSAALGRLVKGEPGAAEDPLIVRLRGPRTVGDVLGQDRQWTWPEFTPRRDAKGALNEQGDDRVTGQGVDQGRLPGALWGDRPGEAWYVLEALARYRQGDASAPYLPQDVPGRGGETERAMLAVRLAQAAKNPSLALEILERHAGSSQNRRWLDRRMALMTGLGQREGAVEAFGAHVRAAQATLTQEDYRGLSALAEDAGLPAPLSLLDPERPVSPAFLAYLRDVRPEDAGRFKTADPHGYRAALAHRWQERESRLSAAQIRDWLRELWIHDSAHLPRQGLAKLGGPWPQAASWLERQPISQRREALESLEAALKPAGADPALFAKLAREQSDDVAGLLALRLRLARKETQAALALAEAMLAGLKEGPSLSFEAPAPLPPESEDGEVWEEPASSSPAEAGDPQIERLRAWLAPFQEAKDAGSFEARVRAFLENRRQEEAFSWPVWKLAFELAPASERSGLAAELEEAWFRGEIRPEGLGPLTETLAADLPSEAARWLARWPRSFALQDCARRAALLLTLKRPADAAKVLFDGRRRTPWEVRDELRAFDLWRRMGSPQPSDVRAPGAWTGALPVWQAKAEALDPLSARLSARPLDALSARAALRGPAGGDENALVRAEAALSTIPREDREGDQSLLHIREARGLLSRSPHAADWALGGLSPGRIAEVLVRRRFRTADINAALADAARLAHQTGGENAVKEALRLLTDRRAPQAKALRAELAAPEAPPSLYRTVDGRPAPLRPRDLTWSLLSRILSAEGVR